MGYISKEEYRKQIDEVISLLEGKIDKVTKQLDIEMKEAADNLDFEKAAYLRDKKLAIENITEKQRVSNISENDIDVIGIARDEFLVCVEVFFVRSSKMVGREHYFLNNVADETDNEILSNFIKQYYIDSLILPNKIMLKEEIDDKELIEEWLGQKADRKVEIKNPQKGEKLRLVEMAEKNAKITLENKRRNISEESSELVTEVSQGANSRNKEKDKYSVVNELKEVLGLENMPRKIECFDISNISGTYIVAGMCVMQDGIIKNNQSKKFKIKTVFDQDDPRCMNEVITRRLKHSIESPNGSFGALPDVIFVDGGITQIRAAREAVNSYNIFIPIYGMVKDDKHRTKSLIDENRQELELSEKLMNVITNFQDSVHDVAIGYHKQLRDKSITKSDLDKLKGIGPAKKNELLKKFGSITKILEAKDEEIAQIKGITVEMAKKIKEELNNM